MPTKTIAKAKREMREKLAKMESEIQNLMEEYVLTYLHLDSNFSSEKAKEIASDAANITMLDLIQENIPHAIENHEENEDDEQ